MKRTFFSFLMASFAFAINAQVVINELMASSDSLSNLPDEYGEYDDWVELYNTSSTDFDLGGYHISDDSTLPTKWAIPAGTTISGNGFLIIWTDKDENNGQVPLHTNFKLSSAGETVLLSDGAGAYLDSIAFGPQQTNRAFARIPNGTGSFEDYTPSFGFSNDDVSSIQQLDLGNFQLFPNPASSEINIKFDEITQSEMTLEIVNLNGQVFHFEKLKNNQRTINISNLSNGSYFLKITLEKNTLLRPFHKL